MKPSYHQKSLWLYGIISVFMFMMICRPVFSDDTCVFGTTADDVPPFIVLLLDNGAEMEQIIWHSGYNNSANYAVGGSVFTNANGYILKKSGNKYYLYPIQNDLTAGSPGIECNAPNVNQWTINIRNITLPAAPSAAVDGDGVKDNATVFRYSQNYLNWIFYGPYAGNGSDLPSKSRFYYAKKAIMNVAKLTSNKAKFAINDFTSNASGASNVQPLGFVVDTIATLPENNILNSNFINNINNMGTVTYSPLAEGLASVAGCYASQLSHVSELYCQKQFALVITPGISSEDQACAAQSFPTTLSNYDGDSEGALTISGTTHTIPINQNGSTYLDDVAHYLYSHDVVGYVSGFQRMMTYTLGFMGNSASNAFLINASNNGNGNLNLYDSSDKEYGKYHFVAENPDTLSEQLLAAIDSIISATSTFTAPVVPVTRTTSGNSIYMAFFKPAVSNFWEGNVTKFGIVEDSVVGVKIVDANGNAATWPNGAIKDDAVPIWTTKNWADPAKANYANNQTRNIYTYLGTAALTASGNAFTTTNASVTAAFLGSPASVTVHGVSVTGRDKVIKYIRGADVLDEDNDNNTTENRAVITGDILHSEPVVVKYNNASSTGTYIFYGANDGMLHAVSDSDGAEAWGFIPADQLSRLKDILEGTSHPYYVDSSPKVYIKFGNGDNVVDTGETAILVCGERQGGAAYFALDITNPVAPTLKWTISASTNPDLGNSWSEPRFGKVKTSSDDITGTHVMFIGGGYSASNSSGKCVLIINVTTGAVEKIFKNGGSISGMDYSIPSTVNIIDENRNGFIDKIYAGDLGGKMWRIGKFTESDNSTPLTFPKTDENINNWTAQVLFNATTARKIYYPASVTLEKGFDMVFFGTGDRNDACSTSTSDRIYAVKDVHTNTNLAESNLVDITDPAAAPPTYPAANGFYLQLSTGEKVLAEGMVFYKVLYITTFSPGDTDPCTPGGIGKLYALNYLTGKAAIDFDGDGVKDRSIDLGGGIPSKPVMVIMPNEPPKLFISVGSTNPDAASELTSAGTIAIDPELPPKNFFYLWWNSI